MDSLTAETHAESLSKVIPLLEEGRHEEALPFLELHRSKHDEPLWNYLLALSLACLTRGPEGLPLLEKAAADPGFRLAFGISNDVNLLAKTSALNHLMFETTVEETASEPWETLQSYAKILDHKEFQAKAIVGRMKLDPENPAVVEDFNLFFDDAPLETIIPILDEVVNQRPHACQPRALLGAFLQQKGKTALAIRHLKTALEADPNAMEPHLYLGKIYSSQARFDDAEKELSLAMSKGTRPTVPLLVELATCQKATYRYEEALETLFSAFEIHPPTFKHWDQLVDTAQTSGHRERLVEVLSRAADQYPANARLRQRFAMVAYQHGDPLAARDQLGATGIFENPTKDPALARLASEVALSLGESGTAYHLVKALWESSPNSPETNRLYGDALLADDRAGEAEAVLRETARNNPNDRALQISWGRALLALGDAERAHRAFGLASRLDPDDPEAMAEQGRAMLLLGMLDEAQNVLKESAKKVDPPLAVTLTGLGSVYEQKQVQDIARDFYKQALRRQEDRLEAACGLVRTRARDGSSPLAGEILEVCSQLTGGFAKLRLYLTLLQATFIEQAPDETRALRDKVHPEVLTALSGPTYLDLLNSWETRLLGKLAKELEAKGQPEKARDIWRYAVTSPLPQLAQQASAELVRLDSYESAASVAAAEDDPLMSLLSTTLPAGSPTENPLFESSAGDTGSGTASVDEEVDLFASDSQSDPDTSEEAPLFAESAATIPTETANQADDDVLAALFALEAPAAEAVSAEASGESPFSEGLPAESELFPESDEYDALFAPDPVPEPAPSVEEQSEVPLEAANEHAPEVLPVPDNDPISALLAVPLPAPVSEPEDVAIAMPSSQSEMSSTPEVAIALPEADSVPTEVDPEPTTLAMPAPGPDFETGPTDSNEDLGELASEFPQESSPVQEPVAVEPPNVEPSIDPAPTDPLPSADGSLESGATESDLETPAQVTREELLPIPMAADFSPLTRRQLHYHEAFTGNGAGLVNPESLAHLLLQSAVGHEPPDPGSEAGTSSAALLQRALLGSAQELEQAEQFRGAVRVLRTALLYQPSAQDVLDALARVQARWANWLVEKSEFAHAVSLIRDSLQRQPQSDTATSLLESTYQRWMTWSADSGDTAARDLLAVYLEQEKMALAGLRQEWQSRQAELARAPVAPTQAPPPVAPAMPTGPAPATESAPPTPAPPVPAVAAPAPVATAAPVAEVAPPVPASAPVAEAAPIPAAPAPPVSAPEPAESKSTDPAAMGSPMFSSKEEALETLDAAPEDESVAEGVFAIFADSMRELTNLLKERSNNEPDSPIWLLLLARAFRRSGSETMAVIQYQKYIKVAPSPEAYEELATTYEELGKDDFAKMTRRKAERAS